MLLLIAVILTVEPVFDLVDWLEFRKNSRTKVWWTLVKIVLIWVLYCGGR